MAIVVVPAIILICIIAAARSDWAWIVRPRTLRRMQRDRTSDTHHAFIEELGGNGIERAVARATYDEMQKVLRTYGVGAFPVRATDSIAMYGLSLTADDDADNPDLRFAAGRIAEATNRQLPMVGRRSTLG